MFTSNKAMRRHVLPPLTCGVLSSSDIMDTNRRGFPGPLRQPRKLLQGTDADSVCIVTHKGFLRELERGPLGQPEASEFSTYADFRHFQSVVSLLIGGL